MNKTEYNKLKKKLGFNPLTETPGRPLSKNVLKLCFEIFKWKYGEKSKISGRLKNNQHSWFVGQATTRFGNWRVFLKEIGFESLQRESKSKEELKRIWRKELYPKYGEKAKSSNWLKNNEYGWFVGQAITRFGKWTNFIKANGYESLYRKLKSKEELKLIWKKELYPKFGDKAKNYEWLRNNKYSWFVEQATTRFSKWSNFIKEMGHESLQRESKSKEELKRIWKKELYPRFGEKAKISSWLSKNQHGWFISQARTRFGKWTNFIKAIEGHFEISVEKMEIY